MKIIDNFLNRITMYKLVLYYLIVILVAAFILCCFSILPYNPLALLFSATFITAICLAVNMLFAWAYNAPTNTESVYITALILVSIISPLSSPTDSNYFILAIWASVLAMASKYILAIKKKHVFNPVAIAVVLTSLFLNQSASWWVGTAYLAPVVLIGGLLLTKKLLRFDLVLSFLLIALLANFTHLWVTITSTSLLFFAFVMLTEPLTTPPTRIRRILYGAFVGFLFLPSIHIGSIYFTPEIALVVGNIFSYIISPKQKLILTLKKRIVYGLDQIHFIFASDERLKFTAGQYLEWTLDKNDKVDSRGNRRYFTIASAPTENEIGLGVKFYPNSSTFKQQLLDMKEGDKIVASQLAGDFVLPKNKNKKLAFIAGGIGITPFHSMIKNLIDKKEKRDIIQFYSNKLNSEEAYKDTFSQAEQQLGIKTVYTVTDKADPMYTGRLNTEMIRQEMPDYAERYFYLSGPHNLVTAFEETLKEMGIKRSHIKTDFFPGFV